MVNIKYNYTADSDESIEEIGQNNDSESREAYSYDWFINYPF
ncbi:MAG: hypothetical protein V4548_13130 [Bacteroidota bacterium]